MTILIAVASRHGSTHEIAEAIADELHTAGHGAEVRPCDADTPVHAYDAVILGSAVYMGNWLPEAHQFVQRHQAWLEVVPVWLFSSGPVGQPDPRPSGGPAHLEALLAMTRAREHQTFVGKLDMACLGLVERVIAGAVKAPTGDFRDWPAIRAWAREIAATLPTAGVPREGVSPGATP
jgi:menaquinone-dependent protoporphyrinogen oxidase